MAQRSATARHKLGKISGGITKFYGQLTPAPSDGSPSISSRSTGSNSYSLGRTSQKSFLRNLLDNHSDKIRGTLEDKMRPLGAGAANRRLTDETVPKTKRWEGGGRFSQPWDALRRDHELWYPEGDTLVYLSSKNSRVRDEPYRAASFRIPSHIIRQTESPFLIASLSERWEGRPPTPASSTAESLGYNDELAIHSAPGSPTFPPAGGSSLGSPSLASHDTDGVLYEIHFPAPPGGDRTSTLRHHLATRNFFALLLGKAIVGVTLGQALLDLQDRLDIYLPPTSNNVMIMMRYLRSREFDDIRNSAENAAGMLAFAERNAIAGVWREAFIHCIGMLSTLEGSVDYRDISPITQALIDRASLESQVRIGRSDTRLSSFAFEDMWPATSANPPPARIAFDKFQRFLMKHYAFRFGSWPPQYGRFSRMLYVQLQRDFAALYDYLVDRDVMWSDSTDSNRRVMSSPSKTYFRADDDDLPITQMLLAWDARNGHPSIPHPFPLVPQSVSVNRTPAKSGFFGTNKKSSGQDDKMAAYVLTESTNISSLLTSSTANQLVDAFTKFEKAEAPSQNPYDARKGRWILIYGILQTLATVAVDAPELKWTEGVDYFLNAKLRDTPPWAPQHPDPESGFDDSQIRSHCWTVPQTWPARNTWGAGPGKGPTELPVHSPGGISSGEDGDDEMEDVSREFRDELTLQDTRTTDSASSVPGRNRATSSSGSAMNTSIMSTSRPGSSRPSSSPVQNRNPDAWPTPPMPNRDAPVAPAAGAPLEPRPSHKNEVWAGVWAMPSHPR